MSAIANLSQDDPFQSVIDPSYLSNMDYGNGAGTGYNNIFSDADLEAMNAQINPFLLGNAFEEMGSTGLTPTAQLFRTGLTPNVTGTGLAPSTCIPRTGFTPVTGDVLFNSSFAMQAQQGDNNIQLPLTDSYFPPMLGGSSAETVHLENEATSTQQQLQEPTNATENTRKQTRSRKRDDCSTPAAGDVPPVKKRRNRKKKQPPTEEEARMKRERFLERNRIAASKCRTKKKQSTSQLEDKLREFQAERKRMEHDIHLIMSELDLYKEEMQKHAHCGNRAIEIWLNARADAIADKVSCATLTTALSPRTERKISPASSTIGKTVEVRQYPTSQDPDQSQYRSQNHESMSPQSTYSSFSFDHTDAKDRESSVVSTMSTYMKSRSIQPDSGISDIGSPYQSLNRNASFGSCDFVVMDETKRSPTLAAQRQVA